MRRRLRWRDESGSSVVGFALVTPLLCLVTVGLLHLVFVAHARAVLVSAASEGARVGALAGSTIALGEQRAKELAAGMVSPAVLRSVTARRSAESGVPVIVVRIEAAVPLVAGGPETGFVVEGHALVEGLPHAG